MMLLPLVLVLMLVLVVLNVILLGVLNVSVGGVECYWMRLDVREQREQSPHLIVELLLFLLRLTHSQNAKIFLVIPDII